MATGKDCIMKAECQRQRPGRSVSGLLAGESVSRENSEESVTVASAGPGQQGASRGGPRRSGEGPAGTAWMLSSHKSPLPHTGNRARWGKGVMPWGPPRWEQNRVRNWPRGPSGLAGAVTSAEPSCPFFPSHLPPTPSHFSLLLN